MSLDLELIEELKEAYEKHASEASITPLNIGEVFKSSGEPLPAHRVRELMEKKKKSQKDQISFDEFLALFEELDLNKTKGNKFKAQVKKREDVITYQSAAAEGTVHTSSDAEKSSFTNYINATLSSDEHCKKYVPISHVGNELFSKCADGILLCKLINNAIPGTIDERALNIKKINTFTMTENCTLAVASSSAIGCHVVNIHAEDIKSCTPHLVLGLLWQIIKIGLFANINIKVTPDLLCMLNEYETMEELMALSPEDLLLRWFNYQLGKKNTTIKVSNYTSDLKDSVAYSILLEEILQEQIVHDYRSIQRQTDLIKRGKLIVENAVSAGVPALVSAEDIVNGNQRLNMAFVAQLFNLYPHLTKVEEPVHIEETREEKSYKNWINSLGVKPHVSDLYFGVADGLVLLQLFEMIKQKCVTWDKVNRPPFKPLQAHLKRLENCNKVVQVAKQLGFSTVGLSGQDIAECSKMHDLSLIFQMMSRFTMKVLQDLSKTDKPITEAEILKWVNEKLSEKGGKLSSFKDSALIDSAPIFTLLGILQPGIVNFDYVSSSSDYEDRLSNAKYAISLSRKLGASIFALPEDIVELKNKMIMALFACLMVVAYQKE